MKGGSRATAKRSIISVEPIEPSGVALTIAELPRLVIFGETAEDALGLAREPSPYKSATRGMATKAAARVGARMCERPSLRRPRVAFLA
jgi:hypothetical protein